MDRDPDQEPCRALSDIARSLQSMEGSEQRVLRTLDLLRSIVPYASCSLLHVQAGRRPSLVTAPAAPPPAERTQLRRRLLRLVELFREERTHELTADPSPIGRLSVPLVELDEVIGVLEVRSEAKAYSVRHLRLLSVVAAQLAAYLTLQRARTVEADRARQLDEARRAAEAANRAKDELLALVSHELKTPLGSTLAWAQRLGEGELSPAERADAVQGIERGVRAQSKLIDDILDLAGVATAALKLDLRAIEPARRIKNTLEGLRLRAEERAIRLESALDPSITPLVVDPDRFDQIVSNLVKNAIEVTPVGGRVEVRLERSDAHARIRVIDGGTRIAPEVLPHLFERLGPHRAGLGVGLAIVKSLVELHGGSVRAESGGEEAGAAFTVELALVPEARALAGLRILLVDDDEDFRTALRAVLEQRGAEVTAVGSVAEALAALERQRPDVLLSELALPRASGYDLIREVAARDAAPPAAALTKVRRRGERDRAVAAGFRMHLPKPMEVEALITAVAHLAGRPVHQIE